MDSVQYLTSELLDDVGVKHGWFMRYGGVSSGLFESLNGKRGGGDDDANVTENRKRACAALSLDADNVALITHKFETEVLEAKEPGQFPGYDAVLTRQKGLVISQNTADCGTVILAAKSGSVVAVVHGSWHTLKAGIVTKVIAIMRDQANEEIVAGLGPMICAKCYEFGPEAKDLFAEKYIVATPSHPEQSEGAQILHSAQDDTNEKYLVDLKQMIIDQLREAGVAEIDDTNVCTLEDERFFSHRRSGAASGRLITLASI